MYVLNRAGLGADHVKPPVLSPSPPGVLGLGYAFRVASALGSSPGPQGQEVVQIGSILFTSAGVKVTMLPLAFVYCTLPALNDAVGTVRFCCAFSWVFWPS